MKVVRLSERHAAALEELLVGDPITNLFLLGYLDVFPVDHANWWGMVDGEHVLGAALIVPERLMVPWSPDLDHCRAIGTRLAVKYDACMMVGPRAQCDAVWSTWAPGTVTDRWYDQRLYVSDKAVPGERVQGFRRAVADEAKAVGDNAVAMEVEDLGRDPRAIDERMFEATIQRRIKQGQTWVIERGGDLVFQINVGTTTGWGVQVGGTYVPPAHRGKGLAKVGMQELGRRLIPRYRFITLHVNEANTPAVRTYEGSGYRPHAPFRLATLPSTP